MKTSTKPVILLDEIAKAKKYIKKKLGRLEIQARDIACKQEADRTPIFERNIGDEPDPEPSLFDPFFLRHPIKLEPPILPASAPADECVYLYTIVGAPSARLYINKEEAERAARILFPEEDPHRRYARIYFREYHKSPRA